MIKDYLNKVFEFFYYPQPEHKEVVKVDINKPNLQAIEIKKVEDKLVEEVNKILREKEQNPVPYHKNDTIDILNQIKNILDKEKKGLKAKFDINLNTELEINLISTLCNSVMDRLENIEQKNIENENPITRLKDKKYSYYFAVFQREFDKETSRSNTVSLLYDSILEGISESIKESLPDEIYNKMIRITHTQILSDKQSLIASILLSLAEKEDIDSYNTYIHKPKESIKEWISSYFEEFNRDKEVQKLIEETRKKLVANAKYFVYQTNKYIENKEKSSDSIKIWINKLSELARPDFTIKNFDKIQDLGSIFVSNSDFKYLQNELNKKLDQAESQIANSFNSDDSNLPDKGYDQLKETVVDKIITSRIGCLDSCPFCGEICLSGSDGHTESHWTDFHRPRGVSGRIWNPEMDDKTKAGKLIIENCQHAVYNNDLFQYNEEWIPYQERGRVNDYYASWKINGDNTVECGVYWKWFMATYSSQLARQYNVAEPDIPEDWKLLTKEEAFKDLRKKIDGLLDA
jgi:hypothetical protein